MNEMIERVAKAMFEAVEAETHEIFPGRLRKITWEERKQEMKNDPRHGNPYLMARICIEAMREPTDEMKQAAARGVSDSFHEEGFMEGDDPHLWNEFVKAGEEAYKNAIDAALK